MKNLEDIYWLQDYSISSTCVVMNEWTNISTELYYKYRSHAPFYTIKNAIVGALQ